MADLLVSVRVGVMVRVKVRIRLRVRAYVSDVIGRRFEKVRNRHRFENLKKDVDLRYRCL